MRRLALLALTVVLPLPAQAEPLAGDAVRALLAGNSTRGTIVIESPLKGHIYERFFAADGRLFSRNLTKGDADSGTWRVDDGGQVCMTHKTWAQGREYCTVVEPAADGYTRVFNGKPSEAMTVVSGDAFGLGG